MSHQCLADAFIPHEVRYRAEILKDTWGHLAPKKGKRYTGHLHFVAGVFDHGELNPTIISFEFGDLDSSPWLYDAITDFVGDESVRGEVGVVYRFDGYFKNYEFIGKVTECFRAEGGK